MNPTVNKQQLLETLRKNRARHIEIVKEAKIGYAETANRLLQERLGMFNGGHLPDLRFDLVTPKDYTAEYDAVIAMLEWNKAEEIELSSGEFHVYVLDKWNWRGDFLHSNASYSGAASLQLSAER